MTADRECLRGFDSGSLDKVGARSDIGTSSPDSAAVDGRLASRARQAGGVTRLRALRPDLWIIFANDVLEQFFHTAAAPPFTIDVGNANRAAAAWLSV